MSTMLTTRPPNQYQPPRRDPNHDDHDPFGGRQPRDAIGCSARRRRIDGYTEFAAPFVLARRIEAVRAWGFGLPRAVDGESSIAEDRSPPPSAEVPHPAPSAAGAAPLI